MAGALIAACKESAGSGAVRASANRADLHALRILEGPVDIKFGHFGHSLAAPLTFFSDSMPDRPDLVVSGGSKWDDRKSRQRAGRSSVGVYADRAESPTADPQLPELRVDGPWDGDGFGFSLTSLEREGRRPLLLISAPRGGSPKRPDSERGLVHVFDAELLGGLERGAVHNTLPSHMTIQGLNSGSRFGYSMLTEADLDGDGVRDLLIGSPGNSLRTDYGGAVWWISGQRLVDLADSAPGLLSVTDPRLGARRLATGEAGDGLGKAMALGPRQSGRDQVILGAPQAHWSPTAQRWIGPNDSAAGYVLHMGMGVSIARVAGKIPGGQFGLALASGELDGEPGRDLAIAAPFANHVEVRSGPDLESPPRFEITSEQPDSKFGWSLAVLGDLHLAVGAPNANRTGEQAGEEDLSSYHVGAVTIWDLRAAEPRKARRYHGEGPRDHLGVSLIPAGDGKIWAGAPSWPAKPATEQGRVYLLPGR